MKWSNALFIASCICLFKAVAGRESAGVTFWLLVAAVTTFFFACLAKGWKVEGDENANVVKAVLAWKLIFGGWGIGMIAFVFAIVMVVTH